MDLLANNVAAKSERGKKKHLKTESKTIKKVSKSVKSVTSPGKVTKKKKISKTDAAKKKVLKENLKNLENVNSNKLNKTKDLLKENLKSKEFKGVKKNKKKNNEQVLPQIKKDNDNTVQEKKKRKNTETETSKKLKKIKTEDKVSKDKKSSAERPNLNLKQVKKGVETILKLASDESTSQKSLMADEKSPIFLQVCCIKIPKTPTRQLRMALPHSLVSPDDDVALIVKDLKKGRRTDYEPTIDHFRQILDEHKCEQIKTIIPMNQIKTEYDQFELKRNLVNSYDYFLIDGRISGHVARLLGKTFSKKRKLPTSIRMGSKDLKHEVDHALNKTSMQLNSNGDTQIVEIGSTSMTKNQIVENIEAVWKNLAKNYPGGTWNIRALRLKTPKSLAIPIYMTMKSKNEIKVPNIKPKRPKAYKTHEGELTTLPGNAVVTVTPDGTVTLKRTKDELDDDDDVTLPPGVGVKRKSSVKTKDNDEEEEDDDDDDDDDSEVNDDDDGSSDEIDDAEED